MLNARRLSSYDAEPGLLREQFGIEETVLAGGYGYRQVLELVQNGADALLEASKCRDVSGDNRIHVLLHDRRLYVANTGAPLSKEGLDALLRSHSSPKRGNQIGRFGLGFKSLLRLSGQIDIFTRDSGAIRFDPRRCRAELQKRYEVTNAPGMRLAWPLGDEERCKDPICIGMAWAETIVRAKILTEDLVDRIRREIRSFPAEFLLFFPVPTTILLDDGKDPAREVRIEHDAGEHVLHDGVSASRWRVVTRNVPDPRRKRTQGCHEYSRTRESTQSTRCVGSSFARASRGSWPFLGVLSHTHADLRPGHCECTVEAQHRPHRSYRRGVEHGLDGRGSAVDRRVTAATFDSRRPRASARCVSSSDGATR